jgi:hypothetical protein
MSRDTQSLKPPQLLGFAQTFGNQRTMSDSTRSKDGQRPTNNAGPNPKRRRAIDRSEERSPVAQRDGTEASDPTISAGRNSVFPRFEYELAHANSTRIQFPIDNAIQTPPNKMSRMRYPKLLPIMGQLPLSRR